MKLHASAAVTEVVYRREAGEAVVRTLIDRDVLAAERVAAQDEVNALAADGRYDEALALARDHARQQFAGYSQYDGYHDSARWALFVATREVSGKGGVSARKGDYVLGMPDVGSFIGARFVSTLRAVHVVASGVIPVVGWDAYYGGAGMTAVTCEQCREAPATVYAIDPHPGGWGGRYCQACADALRFMVVDRLQSDRATTEKGSSS
jgi:hypothetical protein